MATIIHSRTDERARTDRWFSRPVPATAVLAAILVGLLLLTDGGGFLSTDVGGKLATLEAMERRGDLSPDLGYWAERADPDGSLYPMWSTTHVDDAWINVTTLPMLYLALPLYSVGGAHLAGLVPILGTLLAALGARSLARDLGADGTGAFWIVGLASPATVYALDLWEHSLALGLMVWATVLVLRASRGDGSWLAALGAGLLFGAAAAMRQEALVYGFVAGGALGVRLMAGGRLATAVARGAAMAAGAALTVGANAVLEAVMIGSSTRTVRNTGTAASAGQDLTLRLKEAIITGASPFSRAETVHLLIGLVLVGLLVELGRRALDETEEAGPVRPIALGLAALATLVALGLAVNGLGFIPGLAATTPVAVVGLAAAFATPDRRMVSVIALGSLPLVWMVQFTGGAGPQWGGRYILLSGTLLVVAVATAGMNRDKARKVLHGTALAGVIVTLVGLLWTVERTHAFADAMRALADREEQALVFHDPHLAREGGALVLDEQWLAATGEEEREEAAAVLADLGITEIGFVQHDRGDEALALPGWTITAVERVPLVSGLFVRVTTQTAPT